MKKFFTVTWLSFILLMVSVLFAFLYAIIGYNSLNYISVGILAIAAILVLYVLFFGLLFPIFKDLFEAAKKHDEINIKKYGGFK